jgi:endonuclease VIII
MPEGDTVFALAARLRAALDGRTIRHGELRVAALVDVRLDGRTILGHDTHGKHLLTRMSDNLTLHTHLKMTGSWTITRPGRALPRRLLPDVRVLLAVDSGATAYGILLPVVDVVATDRESEVIGHLGPDPLRADWDAGEAVARLGADPTRPLAAALLEQRNIAGLGNLWANELCFLRGYSPWTPVGEVDLPATVKLAARALRYSATTPGAMQVTTGNTRPGEQHWVAGRAGEPCRRCGTPVRVVAEVPGDPGRRRTWWCPSCQPGPGPDR